MNSNLNGRGTNELEAKDIVSTPFAIWSSSSLNLARDFRTMRALKPVEFGYSFFKPHSIRPFAWEAGNCSEMFRRLHPWVTVKIKFLSNAGTTEIKVI